MTKIEAVKAQQVIDSRGNPTVEAEVLVNKHWFRAMVPAGLSTGKHEAAELRDHNAAYHGKSVMMAVRNVNMVIAKKLIGHTVTDQTGIDTTLCKLDGTANKKKLGANAILAVSLACCRAGAAQEGKHLFEHIGTLSKNKPALIPVPQMNVLNGGAHAGQENDIQEHMIMPVGAKSFSQALQMGSECYYALHSLLKKNFGFRATLVGDEGGFVPPLETVQERLKIMTKAVEEAGYTAGKDIVFALDAAASEFYDMQKQQYTFENQIYPADRLLSFYEDLCEQFPIASIEDPFAEDDWQGWHQWTAAVGKKMQIVGDDLLVTNPDRMKIAAKKEACNALLLKVNQIGTLTEALAAAQLAKKHKWKVVVSHRSGETEDPFIADLAVGLNAGQCKFGAPARSERVAKYNQLLRIEELLGNKARYGLK